MEFSSVPIIVIICYTVGEGYKIIFNKKNYKIIPIIVTVLGALLGALIYITNKELIFNVSSIWEAIIIGIVSGESSTGTNQIIKLIKVKGEEND